jgi:hypothetical protein
MRQEGCSSYTVSALPVAVETEYGADTVLGVDLDVPWLRQGQVQDL